MNSDSTENPTENRLPAVAYLRVSTLEQTKGTSLETQLPRCEAAAAQAGGEVIKVCSDDGVSGALYLSRPGIQEALREIESGRAKMLVFANVDRSGRDVDIVRDIAKRVYLTGAHFVLADTGVVAYDMQGKTRLTMEAMFAEWERDAIRTRTMRGRRAQAEKGRQPIRCLSPYGYLVVTKGHIIAGQYPPGSEGTYVIVELQAQVVREIYQRYVAGESLRAVCQWLNTSGIGPPRPEFSSLETPMWHSSSLRAVLKNPVYKGAPVFGVTENRTDERRISEGHATAYYSVPAPASSVVHLNCEPIVSSEEWDAAQARLAGNAEWLGGNPSRRYLLSGWLICPDCGSRLWGSSGGYKDKRRYACRANVTDARARPEGHVCKFRSVTALSIDTLFADFFGQTFANQATIEDAVRFWQESATDGAGSGRGRSKPEDSIQRIDTELAAVARREQATVTAQIVGIESGTPAAYYQQALTELAGRRRLLEKERETILSVSGNESGAVADDSLAIDSAFRRRLVSGDPKAIAKWIGSLCERISRCLNSEYLTVVEKRSIVEPVLDWVAIESPTTLRVHMRTFDDRDDDSGNGSKSPEVRPVGERRRKYP